MTFVPTHRRAGDNDIFVPEEGVYFHDIGGVMVQRTRSCLSYENEALFVAAVAFLFCGAVVAIKTGE